MGETDGEGDWEIGKKIIFLEKIKEEDGGFWFDEGGEQT